MEHLHDIMSLQSNNFNSFFNGCNNLQGLPGMGYYFVNDNSIQVIPALYMTQGQPSCIGHIIDHLNLELLLYIHVLGYVNRTLKGHCSAECINGIMPY